MKKINKKTWMAIVVIIILIVVVYNQFKYDPLDHYTTGSLIPNDGSEPANEIPSARYSG